MKSFFTTWPQAKNEDKRRKQFIIHVLSLGLIAFCSATLIFTLLNNYIFDPNGAAESFVAVPVAVGLFTLVRYVAFRVNLEVGAYLLIVVFFALAFYASFAGGILLPQAILTFSLVVVTSGILISSFIAIKVALFAVVSLLFIKALEDNNLISFDTSWMEGTGGYFDIVIFGFTFLTIGLVSWLSNREIEKSLSRARKSEADLLVERDSLDAKVKQRTKQLEQAQIEKVQDLQRFAEFGRVTSTLLHDLSNPLTAVSLNLEQAEESDVLTQAKDALNFMENYVNSARKQLKNQSEISEINLADEINDVLGLLESKANRHKVGISKSLEAKVLIHGDPARFSQIISNLVVNAIESYKNIQSKNKKVIVSLYKKNEQIVLKVQDFGSGISKKDIAHVFDPFYTTKRTSDGTGIGLSITKRIIEEDFGGNIAVSSTGRNGSVFTVKIAMASNYEDVH